MNQREHNIALREAAQIAASDGYFGARPQIDSGDRRRVFEAGFNRAWEEVEKLQEMLRTSFSDNYGRIEIHYRDHHVRRMFHMDESGFIQAMAKRMWEQICNHVDKAG